MIIMAINKVTLLNGETLIDLTGDTVTTANDIALGKVGHLRDGTVVTGTHSGGSVDLTGDATPSDVRSGSTFYSNSALKQTGTAASYVDGTVLYVPEWMVSV